MGLISVSPILPLNINLKGIEMPVYEYKCSFGKQFDTILSIHEEKLVKGNKKIQDCNQDGTLKRLISAPAIFSDDIGRGHERMKDKDLYKELEIE